MQCQADVAAVHLIAQLFEALGTHHIDTIFDMGILRDHLLGISQVERRDRQVPLHRGNLFKGLQHPFELTQFVQCTDIDETGLVVGCQVMLFEL